MDKLYKTSEKIIVDNLEYIKIAYNLIRKGFTIKPKKGKQNKKDLSNLFL